MIAWINFAVLLFASILFLLFYVRSASPAGREKVIGPRAYPLCFRERLAAGTFEFLITANFILYYFFPLPTPLPVHFPWSWWVSLVIAALIGIPATVLMIIGLRDAGEEAMRPKKNTPCTAVFIHNCDTHRPLGKYSCSRSSPSCYIHPF